MLGFLNVMMFIVSKFENFESTGSAKLCWKSQEVN